jgi:hypothetical protein
MSCVFQNIDPPPPTPLSARRLCNVYPPPLLRGEDTLAGWRGGSIFWKTQDTALYSTYIESSLTGSINLGTDVNVSQKETTAREYCKDVASVHDCKGFSFGSQWIFHPTEKSYCKIMSPRLALGSQELYSTS